MSTSLLEIWEASAANPYYPAVPKERQFLVGATLLVLGRLHLPYNRLPGLIEYRSYAE